MTILLAGSDAEAVEAEKKRLDIPESNPHGEAEINRLDDYRERGEKRIIVPGEPEPSGKRIIVPGSDWKKDLELYDELGELERAMREGRSVDIYKAGKHILESAGRTHRTSDRKPLAFNLVEDSILSPHYGKSYVEKELKRGLITDPYGYAGRMPDEEKKNGGFWARWKAYRKTVKEKWPLVRGSELGKIWKIPAHYYLYKWLDGIRKKPEDRHTAAQDILGALLDTYWVRYRESYSQLPFQIFPKLRIWVSYAEGATKIDNLYVVDVDGYDVPVFLEVGKDPEVDEIKKNIDHAEDKKESVYDKMGDPDNPSTEPLLNPDFVQNALDKYSKLDYSTLYRDQPQKLHRALVKDDTWYIQQYGEQDAAKEAALDAQLPADYQGKVKIYKRPTGKSGFWYNLGKYLMFDETPRSGGMLWYWLVGDVLYDIVDTMYEPVQHMMEKAGVTPEGIRIASELEYRGIAGARRGLFNPRSPTMTYKKKGALAA